MRTDTYDFEGLGWDRSNTWSDYRICMTNRGKSATNTSLQNAKETSRYVANTANTSFQNAKATGRYTANKAIDEAPIANPETLVITNEKSAVPFKPPYK